MINERLQEFMDEQALNAKALAEIIDVQPSSISHILKGRNKPSLDLIQKIMVSFPDFDLKYFVTGKRTELSDNKEGAEHVNSAFQSMKSPIGTQLKEIKQVMLLYTDGSFEAFSPAD